MKNNIFCIVISLVILLEIFQIGIIQNLKSRINNLEIEQLAIEIECSEKINRNYESIIRLWASDRYIVENKIWEISEDE